MSTSSVMTAWRMTKAANVDLNGMAFAQRATAFAGHVVAFESVVLLTRREGESMASYLLTNGTGADASKAAVALAQTVGGQAEQVEVPSGLEVGNVVGWLEFESGSAVARDPQMNADPTELARQLANTLPDGAWVAVVMRKPSKRERSRHNEWLKHRLAAGVPNHHSLLADAMIVSVFAGGEDPDSVRSFLETTRSSMPGFDVITRGRVATRASTLKTPMLLAAAGVASGGVFASLGASTLSDALFVGAAASAALGGGRFVGPLPSSWRWSQSVAYSSGFDAPKARAVPPKKPRSAIERADKTRKAREGDYPLHRSAFLVGPQVVLGLVAPHAGARSGVLSTQARPVPPVMLRRLGPLVGQTDQGNAYLPASDAFGGVAIVGKAGSGKMQPLTTRIPVPVSSRFPSGWATVGELVQGDAVFAPDGSATRIGGFSDVETVDRHLVTFDDDQVVECGPEHLWRVSTRSSRVTAAAASSEDVARATQLRALAFSRPAGEVATVCDLAALTSTTVELVEEVLEVSGMRALAVTCDTFPIALRGQAVAVEAFPIAEFALTLAGRFGDVEEVIMSTAQMLRLMRRSDPLEAGLAVRVSAPICGPEHDTATDPYTAGLAVARAHGATQIPAAYRRGSVYQRREFLRGMMDAAGHTHTDGSSSLEVSGQTLARHALELVRSLGIVATVSTPASSLSGSETTDVDLAAAHTITFTHAPGPFVGGWLGVRSVEVRGVASMRCLRVEHPSGMYLSDGFVATHNSVLVRSLFGWACAERTSPAGFMGYPGQRNALVAFESKGDGLEQYAAWSRTVGDEVLLIDLADPTTWSIDLFDVPGTVLDKANFFVNAMIYTFGESAIAGRSTETLLSVLPAALCVTPEMAARVEGLTGRESVIKITQVLLGGRGDSLGVALANELRGESVRENADAMLREVVLGMGPIYGDGVSVSARTKLVEAPRNKLRQLVEMEDWWRPDRRKVGWTRILEGHRSVVINTGTSRGGRIVEDELNRQMSALLMYSLRHAIQRTCSGWQEQERSVSIFSDELSLLAGSSDKVIAWLKDQGRSFGVRPVFATQRPEQLTPQLRKAFMNFSTLITYMQEDMQTAREIAEGLSAEEGEWTASEILNLDTYQAVVRAHADKRRFPAYTVRVPNFESDRSGTLIAQNYRTVESGGVPGPGVGVLGGVELESSGRRVAGPGVPVPEPLPQMAVAPVLRGLPGVGVSGVLATAGPVPVVPSPVPVVPGPIPAGESEPGEHDAVAGDGGVLHRGDGLKPLPPLPNPADGHVPLSEW